MISKAADVTVVIMGGGKGERLYPLTANRAKPAVSFGGKYRLIDIPITNCLLSQFNKIFILTQFNSFSLNRHIWQTYSRTFNRDGFIDIIAAEQRLKSEDWFQGTADAVRQSMDYLLFHRPKYILILSGDQVYSMDYYKLLLWHEVHDAQITIAAHYSDTAAISSMGVIKVAPSLRVLDFCEKPQSTGEVDGYAVIPPGSHGQNDKSYLGSMGIYLFNADILKAALDNKEVDFGRGVIPLAARNFKMLCYPFEGYWEDVGTIQAFYDANMKWREGRGISEMFQNGNVIYTNSRQLPPTRINGTTIADSLIADGCHIQADHIERSIIGIRTRIDSATLIRDSIIMGNDYDQRDKQLEIGPGCVIEKTICDKNVVIGANCRLTNAAGIQEGQTEHCYIRSGIIVIPHDTIIPPGTII